MVGLKKEKIYVTYTCKRCGCAFMDLDADNSINDIPLKTRYCPQCVAMGYTNRSKSTKKDKIKDMIKAKGITDKKDIAFINKYIKKQIEHKEKTNQRIYLSFLFNDAVEVLGYQSWKNIT